MLNYLALNDLISRNKHNRINPIDRCLKTDITLENSTDSTHTRVETYVNE